MDQVTDSNSPDTSAEPVNPNTPPPAAPVPSAPDTSNLPIQQAKPQAEIIPQPPTVVKPAKRGGLAGVFDDIADSIVGTQGPGKVYKDAQGNEYIEHPGLSHKGQWLKIASEAVRGAGAGMAAGPGPGGKARALEAGIQDADKQNDKADAAATQQKQEVRQANQDLFNQVKLKHDMAAQEFELSRMKVKATQDDVNFAQGEVDRMNKMVTDGKAVDLGTYADEAELANVKKANPNFWKDVYQNNITAVPEIGPDGQRKGIHLFQTTPGAGNELVPPGTSFKAFMPPSKPGEKPTLIDQVPSGPMTTNQKHAYDLSAATQMQDWQIKDADRQEKESAARKNKVDADTLIPSEVSKNKAEAARDQAEADAAKDADINDPALIEQIGTGKVAPERIGYLLGKKEGQKLLASVAAAYPNLDTSKLAGYPKMWAAYTSGPIGNQRQNLDNAFKAVDDLTNLNTYSSRLPSGKDRTQWDNRLAVASQEIANGLAKPGVQATRDSIADIRKSLNTTFSRQAAIDKQIDSLMDQYESMRTRWAQGAPSEQYIAKMPDVGSHTKEIMYKHDKDRMRPLVGVPVYSDKAKVNLIGFSKDGQTMEPAQ